MTERQGDSRIMSALERCAAGAPVVLEGHESSSRRAAALRIAAGLLCAGNNGQGKPCLACGSCIRFRAGTHPDCHILDFDGKAVKIEQVRELRAQTFVKPQEAETKVFIIIDADRLSEQCQNALLKVLEEPQNCMFLLTVTNSAALLSTVYSRCKIYRLDSPSDAQDLQDPPEWRVLADELVDSLYKSELDIFQAASRAESLKREQYPEFLDCICDALLRKHPMGDRRAFAIYEYLCTQREMLPHNPGVAALTGALAAFCGSLSAQERGQAI